MVRQLLSSPDHVAVLEQVEAERVEHGGLVARGRGIACRWLLAVAPFDFMAIASCHRLSGELSIYFSPVTHLHHDDGEFDIRNRVNDSIPALSDPVLVLAR